MWTLGGLLLKRSQAVLALDVRRGTTLGRPLGDRQLQLLGRAAVLQLGSVHSPVPQVPWLTEVLLVGAFL